MLDVLDKIIPSEPELVDSASSFPLQWLANYGSKNDLFLRDVCPNLNLLKYDPKRFNKRINKRILCLLPVICRWLKDAQLTEQTDCFIRLYGINKPFKLLKSMEWQRILKIILNKTAIPSIKQKYNLPIDPATELVSWHRPWLIKSPALRAIKLKIGYKDVFSNERRHRFKLTDSSELRYLWSS